GQPGAVAGAVALAIAGRAPGRRDAARRRRLPGRAARRGRRRVPGRAVATAGAGGAALVRGVRLGHATDLRGRRAYSVVGQPLILIEAPTEPLQKGFLPGLDGPPQAVFHEAPGGL